MKLFKYTMRGYVGTFPYDMLRYDSCWPSNSQSVTNMVSYTLPPDPNISSLIKVTLVSIHEPTIGRWESFSWRPVGKTETITV